MRVKLLKGLFQTVLTMVMVISVTTLDNNITADSNSHAPETDLPFEY